MGTETQSDSSTLHWPNDLFEITTTDFLLIFSVNEEDGTNSKQTVVSKLCQELKTLPVPCESNLWTNQDFSGLLGMICCDQALGLDKMIKNSRFTKTSQEQEECPLQNLTPKRPSEIKRAKSSNSHELITPDSSRKPVSSFNQSPMTHLLLMNWTGTTKNSLNL